MKPTARPRHAAGPSVDRIFLAGYVPRLQCDGQLVRFLLDRVGGNIPSPAILGRIGRGYVEAVDRFALDHEIPVVRFSKGERKEDVARSYLQRAEREGRCGVALIGVAQEKAMRGAAGATAALYEGGWGVKWVGILADGPPVWLGAWGSTLYRLLAGGPGAMGASLRWRISDRAV